MASEAAERALAIHRRLIADDPTASADLFETMLVSVEAYLLKYHSSALDRESLRDIAVDTLMSYVQSPQKFDSSKAGLYRYLTLIAEGDVRDAIRSRSRQPRRFEPLVEDHRPPANSLGESEERRIPLSMEMRADAIAVLNRYQGEICTEPGDAAVLALILQEERDSTVFARVLGLDDPDGADARRKVLQVKDKITRRLRRLKDKLTDDRS